MSGHDEFRSWRWDREDKAAGKQALVIERHGHRIVADHDGLLIDGQRLDPHPFYEGLTGKALHMEDTEGAALEALRLDDDGLLVYRGRPVACLHPCEDGTANPGRLDLLTTDTASPRHLAPRRSTVA